jgi:glycosyltransferase involved in cell wall biosynthesis
MSQTPILYIDLAPSPGGSHISLAYLLRGLDSSKWTPVVVLSRQNPCTIFEEMGIPVERVRTPQWESQPAALVDVVRRGKTGNVFRSLPVASTIWHWGGSLRYWRRDILPVADALTPIIRQHRPALVHLNNSVALMRPGIIAAWRAHARILIHSRSFDPLSFIDRRVLAPRVDGMIFISRAVAQAQLHALKSPPPYRVIPNAVDPDLFSDLADRKAVRERLGVAADAPLIGMIGRIIPWKGQSVFVEAFARLHQVRPDAVAIIVGEADTPEGDAYRQVVKKRIRELGLEEKILWLGHRQDIPEIMAALDLLAHCSVTPEPFGRVIIEGMAAGAPVIASNGGGAAEIVEDGVNGLLTRPGDAKALAAAMKKLLEDDSLRERLRENGRKTVQAHYTVETHVEAVSRFYEQVLASDLG